MVRVRIDELLKARGQTAYWLAKETGLPHSTIYKLRYGQMKGMTFNTLESLCKALKCGPGDLFVVSNGRANAKKAQRNG